MPDDLQLLEYLPAVPWERPADDCRFHFVGPQAEALLGFDLAEWYKPEFWASHLHPEDRDKVLRLSAGEIRLGNDHTLEYRMLAADGRTVWITDLVRVISIDGIPKQCCGLLLDVTSMKRKEDEDRLEREQMIQKQKRETLSVLAGGIAHAFNNLLTGVLGYAELASRELPDGGAAMDYLEEVSRSARRGADLTEQLLIHAGKGRFVFRATNLTALVHQMGRVLLSLLPLHATLRFECIGDCPLVAADDNRVHKMIVQLVANAAEALINRKGAIVVRTRVRQVDHPNEYTPYGTRDLPGGQFVALEVTDTGSGMTEATMKRIFDPFFTTRFTGRGLGLAAVLGIVEAHDALIRVTSTPKKGSAFEILFPVLGEDEELDNELDDELARALAFDSDDDLDLGGTLRGELGVRINDNLDDDDLDDDDLDDDLDDNDLDDGEDSDDNDDSDDEPISS